MLSEKHPTCSNKKLLRQILLTLFFKITVIAFLGILFFGSEHRITTTPENVRQRVLPQNEHPQHFSEPTP